MDLALTFESLCRQVESHNSLTVKEEIVKGYLERFEELATNKGKGDDENEDEDDTPDLLLIYRLLLPKQSGRLYHMQDKQLIKVLSTLLKVPEATLKDSVNKTGNIGVTAQQYFKIPTGAPKRSKMTLFALDAHLEALAAVTTEDKQTHLMDKFLKQASSGSEVRLYLEQIKHELRLGASIPILLGALHPMAYKVYQQCANIAAVVKKVIAGDVGAADDGRDSPKRGGGRSPSPAARGATKLVASVTLDMPIAPMLAAPSKDVEQVLLKCPNGAFSEVKYDGERIQIHKNGDSFKYFARSLLPVKEDKYEGLEVHLKKATAHLTDVILDGEILMVDKKTEQPLAFGTLGKHKKAGLLATANTGLFIFDILYLNGKSLLQTPLDKRRQILSENLKLQPLRIFLSEKRNVVGTKEQQKKILDSHLQHAIKEGLEGLVVKDMKGPYEPAQRHWVKMKKDYLAGMADSADLVVLGGNYGSGNKKGQLSIFLLGVLNKKVSDTTPGRWKTVVKVGNGHDDAMIIALNKKYKDKMIPCDRRNPPSWLDSKAAHRPDMIWKTAPTDSDVWEIKGAEYTQTKNHTANGISLRFPRVERIRDDKTPQTATSLEELTALYEASKEKYTRMHDLPGDDPDADNGTGGGAGGGEVILPPSVASAPTAGGGTGPLSPFADAAPPVPEAGTKPIARAPTVPPPTATAGLARQGTVAMAAAADISVLGKDISLAVREASTNGKKGGHVLLHVVAAGGKWIPKGVMGSINKNFGPSPSDDYNGQSRDLTLGKVHVSGAIHPDPKNKSSFVVILSLVAQTLSPKRGQPPTLDHSSLAVGLQKAAKYAVEQGATTHFARPPSDAPPTGIAWPALQSMLVRHYVSKNLPLVVYSRDPSLTRVGSAAGPSLSVGASLSASVPVVGGGGGDSDDVLCAVTAYLDSEMPQREAEGVRQKLTMMGASVTADRKRASHVILGSTSSPAIASMGGVQMCLKKEWVDACFLQEKLVDISSYRVVGSTSAAGSSSSIGGGAPPVRAATNVFDLLKNCRIVIQGFAGKELSELQSKIGMMGGTLHDKWTQGGRAALGGGPSTHMICGSWSPSAMKASDNGGAVVKREWLDDTFAKGARQPLEKYYVQEDNDNDDAQDDDAVPASAGALNGLTFYLERYAPSDAHVIKSRIEALGGGVATVFTKGTPGLFVLSDNFHTLSYNQGTPLLSCTDRSLVLGGEALLNALEAAPAPVGALKLKSIFAKVEYDELKKAQAGATQHATPSKQEKGGLTASRSPATALVQQHRQEAETAGQGSTFGNDPDWATGLHYTAGAILNGCTFYIEGYSPKMAASLKTALTKMGATVSPSNRGSSPSFYIICDMKTSTTDAITESGTRARILSHTFVKDCYCKNKLVDSSLYSYDKVRKAAPSAAAPSAGGGAKASKSPVAASRGKRGRDIVTSSEDDEDEAPPAPAAPTFKRRQVVNVPSSSSDSEVEDYVASIKAETPVVSGFKKRQPVGNVPSSSDEDDRTETASFASDETPPEGVLATASFKRRTVGQKNLISSSASTTDAEDDNAPPARRRRLEDDDASPANKGLFDPSKVPTVAPNLFADYNLVLFFNAGEQADGLIKRYCEMTSARYSDRKLNGGDGGRKFTIALVTGSVGDSSALHRDAKRMASGTQGIDAVSERWFWSCVQQNRVLPTSSFLA